ncbi:nuclear transport factor 2 family protein [Streptomyces sp. NPDC021098]|uniref:nuclear transport factor 2 family protein n=1 Tax=unclassified Streptomyces TaxID=2593676 RepID=UPI0037BBFB70
MDLERRLRDVEARLAVQELVARYCLAIDDRDWEALAALFDADATMPIRGEEARGRTAVVDALRERLAGAGRSVHAPHSCVLDELDEERARGTVLGHVEMGLGGATHIGALRYADAYVRRGDRWVFARREMTYLHMGPWSEVGRSLL